MFKTLPLSFFLSFFLSLSSLPSTYIPTETDVGHKLKIEVSSLKTKQVAIFKESEPVIERMSSSSSVILQIAPSYAQPRQWKSILPPGHGSPSSPANLRITSFNMLADIYCRPELYQRTPRWALDWNYRRDRLQHQLDSRNSDVFCLQEVEKGEYETYWLPQMISRGYEGM